MTWTKTANIIYTDGGTKVPDAVKALDDECDLIYTHLNSLQTASASAVGGNLTRNIFLARYSSSDVILSASSRAPAVIEINGEVLTNTSSIYMATSNKFDSGSGLYAIYAQKAGATTNFELKRIAYASIDDLTASQRIVGYAYHSGSEFVFIKSQEARAPQMQQVPEALFHAYVTTTQAGVDTTPVTLVTATELYDYDDCHANGVFTAPRAGWYEFNVRVRNSTESTSASNMYAMIKHNTTIVARNRGQGYVQVSHVLLLASGDTVTATVATVSASGVTLGNTYPTDNSFWGRFIGTAVGV